MVERRDVCRYKTNLNSSYKLRDSHQEKDFQCTCQDISTKGARLILNEPLAVGKEIELNFKLPRFFSPICVKAQVIWQNEEPLESASVFSAGIYFTHIKDRDRTNIIDFQKESFPEEILKQWWSGV
jgi:hypothetical protein